MSEVPKGRRNHSKLEAQTLASDIRGQITTEIMVTFGYSQKKYEDHIKAMTGYIQNPEEREAVAETIRKLEENFEGWFIVKERDRMFQLACDIPSHLREANAILPKIYDEYVERRLHPSTGSDLKRTFTSISMKQARMRAIFSFGIIAAITQTFSTKSAWTPSAVSLTENP